MHYDWLDVSAYMLAMHLAKTMWLGQWQPGISAQIATHVQKILLILVIAYGKDIL